jgi:hypothetical protein
MSGNDNAAFIMNNRNQIFGRARFCDASSQSENQIFTFRTPQAVAGVNFLAVDQHQPASQGLFTQWIKFNIRPAHAMFGQRKSGKARRFGLPDQIFVLDEGTAGIAAGVNVQIKPMPRSGRRLESCGFYALLVHLI